MEVRQNTAKSWATLSMPAGRFALRFMEMCFAMCAGGAILNLLVFAGIAAAGYDLPKTSPELSMLIHGVDWAIAMVAWMAFGRHVWRHNIEMSSTAIIAALGFALARLGRPASGP